MPKSAQGESSNPGNSAHKKVPTAIDRHVGTRLKAMREARALSQAELGAAIGVSALQVQNYECGRDRIGAGALFDLARVLGVAVSAFYEGLG